MLHLGILIASCALIATPTIMAEGETPTSEETPSTSIMDSESTPVASESESASEDLEPVSSEDLVTSDNEGFDWNEWLTSWVDPAVLATLTAIVGALAAVLRMAKSVKDMAKSKQLTVEQVQQEVIKALKECVGDDVSKSIDQYLPQIVSASQKTDKVLVQFAKILALSQEQTAEAKLAILNAVQELGLITNEAVEEAKEEVKKQAEEEKTQAKAKAEAVAKVIEETSSYDGTSI